MAYQIPQQLEYKEKNHVGPDIEETCFGLQYLLLLFSYPCNQYCFFSHANTPDLEYRGLLLQIL